MLMHAVILAATPEPLPTGGLTPAGWLVLAGVVLVPLVLVLLAWVGFYRVFLRDAIRRGDRMHQTLTDIAEQRLAEAKQTNDLLREIRDELRQREGGCARTRSP